MDSITIQSKMYVDQLEKRFFVPIDEDDVMNKVNSFLMKKGKEPDKIIMEIIPVLTTCLGHPVQFKIV
uniref:Uncharacterized protein n=1 Tax=viral metagenome TaxID=1070528 RepID=A0A6M3KUH2_9ZZZZ